MWGVGVMICTPTPIQMALLVVPYVYADVRVWSMTLLLLPGLMLPALSEHDGITALHLAVAYVQLYTVTSNTRLCFVNGAHQNVAPNPPILENSIRSAP